VYIRALQESGCIDPRSTAGGRRTRDGLVRCPHSSQTVVRAYTSGMDNTNPGIDALNGFLQAHPKLVILTGAGISAASGIPTYRDREGIWRHSEPVKHQEFILEESTRQRYWARSLYGWPTIRDAQPAAGHRALAQLERSGRVQLLITQNVDRLHQRAGSDRVIDLHGRLDRVRCLDCQAHFSRELIQQRLVRDNGPPGKPRVKHRPDGDAELPNTSVLRLRTPSCQGCGGILMPDVVFFGGTVPKTRVESCMEAIAQSDALLAIGSSLQVYSGFRFCRRAKELCKPVAIINPGKTRADALAQLKIRQECGPLLQRLVQSIAPDFSQADVPDTPASSC
jgi:NAD-dependent SIR2 family protein deacetylase